MKNKPTFFDFVLVLFLLAVSIHLLLNFNMSFKTGPTSASLSVDGVSKEIDLLKDAQITIKDNFILEIKSGEIRVLLSDCSRQICAHMGWISKPGEALVCVPNKIIVKLKADDKYDAITR